MIEPVFHEIRFESGKYWKWKYQYYCAALTQEVRDELYEWLLENIHTTLGWFVRDVGVIIFKEEDAFAFKMRWV